MTDSTVVQVRVLVGVKAGWVERAGACGLSLSEWVRSVLDEEMVVRSGEVFAVPPSSLPPVVPSPALDDPVMPETLGSFLGGLVYDVSVPVVVAKLAASVPGVTVGGVDHVERRGLGLFDDGCLFRSAHSGGLACRGCGGVTW